MTSSYQLPSRVVRLLETYEFHGAPIWRLSEGKHGIVKLELTWQPPTQQHKRQKKTPGRKKEATIPPADEWPRQPSPAKTPPPAVQNQRYRLHHRPRVHHQRSLQWIWSRHQENQTSRLCRGQDWHQRHHSSLHQASKKKKTLNTSTAMTAQHH